MNIYHSIFGRIASGLALLMSMVLFGGCATAPAVSNTDPEYARALAEARTECKGNEIVGVWAALSTPEMINRGEKAAILLIRADGTGLARTVYTTPGAESFTAAFLWRYQGAGVWTAGPGGYFRFAGNALAFENKGTGGGPAAHVAYARTGNDSFN